MVFHGLVKIRGYQACPPVTPVRLRELAGYPPFLLKVKLFAMPLSLPSVIEQVSGTVQLNNAKEIGSF